MGFKLDNLDNILNQVICGNSLEFMGQMPNDCIDLVVTSPPYYGLRQYGKEDSNELGQESTPQEYVVHIAKFGEEIKRILKPTGSFYLNLGDTYYGPKGFAKGLHGHNSRNTHTHYKKNFNCPEDGQYLQHKQLLLLPARVAIALQEQGWIIRNQIIWEKPNAMPVPAPDRRLPTYEVFYHCVKDRKYYYNESKAKELKQNRDVIRHSISAFDPNAVKGKHKKHAAVFPETLIHPMIIVSSQQNDVVLDPFGGSGTVGLVAYRAQRQFIMIEQNPSYCEDATNKINDSVASWMTNAPAVNVIYAKAPTMS